MRLKLISCEIFFREMCAAVARSPHRVDIEFLPKGLHDKESKAMRAELQARIDAAEAAGYDAVLLGYGLCGNGISGLAAHTARLVVPRAHDCITLFFGSKERYGEYFREQPGVYFKTTGWIERGQGAERQVFPLPGGNINYAELVAKYGEENADYLWRELAQYPSHYQQFTYIRMGLEQDDRFEEQAREEAAQRGWKFSSVQGDMGLIHRMIEGDWNEREFLVVEPGHRVVARYDEGILGSEKLP